MHRVLILIVLLLAGLGWYFTKPSQPDFEDEIDTPASQALPNSQIARTAQSESLGGGSRTEVEEDTSDLAPSASDPHPGAVAEPSVAFVDVPQTTTSRIVSYNREARFAHAPLNEPIARERAEKAGVYAIPIEREGRYAVLRFTVKVKPVCFVGDFDAISRELSADEQTDLIVSVESVVVGGKSASKAIATIPLSGMQEDYQVTLRVPAPTQVSHLGLFLCKDKTGVRSCHAKEAASVDEITKNLRRKKLLQQSGVSSKQTSLKDKIYFFQYILLSSDHMQIAQRPWQEESERAGFMQSLGDYLVTLGTPEIRPESVITRVERLTKILGSLNFEVSDDFSQVTLFLPKYTPESCEP